jgi:pSer/pThr/pTyr-binding forkhead associated (FHA) protein
MGSIIFKAILGMVAGVLAWALIEPFKPDFMDETKWGMFEVFLMLAWGLFIGGAVGFSNGWGRGSRIHALREFAFGALFACIGVSIGRGLSTPFTAMIGTPLTVIGRTLALGCIGAGIGAGVGICTFVPRRGLQGLIGGALGGAIAGMFFDSVAGILSGLTLLSQGIGAGTSGEVGAPSRALTGALMGGCIALMIGIIEALSKSAWLRLELGRNEGKEWVLDKPRMMIGRFERADIPIFGDQSVAPQHAVIHKQGSRYVLVDQGSPVGTGVNGQRIQEFVLNPNDVIQLGNVNLRFITKNVKAPKRDPEAMRNMAYPISPAQPQYSVQPQPSVQPTMVQQQPYGQPPQSGHPQSGQPPYGGQPTMVQQPYAQPGSFQPGSVQPGSVQPGSSMQPTVAVPAQPQSIPTQMSVHGSFSLVALDGPLMGQRFPLSGPVELGRESVQVPMSFDTSASRKHARIEQSGGTVNVSDLGSTNGTFINGQRVSNASAKNGDIVKVGTTNFRIES